MVSKQFYEISWPVSVGRCVWHAGEGAALDLSLTRRRAPAGGLVALCCNMPLARCHHDDTLQLADGMVSARSRYHHHRLVIRRTISSRSSLPRLPSYRSALCLLRAARSLRVLLPPTRTCQPSSALPRWSRPRIARHAISLALSHTARMPAHQCVQLQKLDFRQAGSTD
jgi:hypothetical protein